MVYLSVYLLQAYLLDKGSSSFLRQSNSLSDRARPQPFCVYIVFRSSHWSCSVKKGVFKNFVKFLGN